MLGSKKMVAGHDFKTAKIPKTSPWATAFNKVTPDALMLFVHNTNAAHKRQLKSNRRKLSRKEADERLEWCYLAPSGRSPLSRWLANIVQFSSKILKLSLQTQKLQVKSALAEICENDLPRLPRHWPAADVGELPPKH